MEKNVQEMESEKRGWKGELTVPGSSTTVDSVS